MTDTNTTTSEREREREGEQRNDQDAAGDGRRGGRSCPTCGAGPSFVIPVWEDPTAYENAAPPDYLGCTECHTMHDIRDKTVSVGGQEL